MCLKKQNKWGSEGFPKAEDKKGPYFGKMLFAPAGSGGLGGGTPGVALARESGSKVNTVSLAADALAASTLS